MLVYDLDSILAEFLTGIHGNIQNKGCIYTTHSHTPANPRARMDGVASDMVINPQIGRMETATAAVSAGTADTLTGITSAIREGLSGIAGQSGDIVIPVYLGSTMLDEVIINAQQRANLRSGGR